MLRFPGKEKKRGANKKKRNVISMVRKTNIPKKSRKSKQSTKKNKKRNLKKTLKSICPYSR